MHEHPVVSCFTSILSKAYAHKASDIHLEPFTSHMRVRLRIDGVLQSLDPIAISLADALTAHIKVLAQLDIANKRIPQDGRFSFSVSPTQKIDCRVSTCPTVFGEKTVIRLADPYVGAIALESLGMHPNQLNIFKKSLLSNTGMIVVCGPTGSGKTITVYSALTHLNAQRLNICTVEDPVEQHLANITQVQVQPKAGLCFATALRAFLRQDPDVILVGEMRDTETAQIAIKAAQTGHLVLSSVHTHNAVQSILRILQMGIEAHNAADAIGLIVAQKLVRRLCPFCKNGSLPVGCAHCIEGYKGQVGIFELLPMRDAIKNVILQGANIIALQNAARAEQIQTLEEAGLLHVQNGITSLEEIYRI